MDYYLIKLNQVKRLITEYEKYNRLVIAYDFDNTVYDYHNKGYDFSKVIELLRECKKLGFYLIVYTCKTETQHEFIEKYLEKNNIPFDTINKNAPFIDFPCEKLYYNILLDDRAGLESAYLTLKTTIEAIKRR